MKRNKEIEKITEQIMWVFLQAYEAGLFDYKNKTIGGGGVEHSKRLKDAEKLELELIKVIINLLKEK